MPALRLGGTAAISSADHHGEIEPSVEPRGSRARCRGSQASAGVGPRSGQHRPRSPRPSCKLFLPGELSPCLEGEEPVLQ
eukprot:5946001-Pyramimonas_sp.AAC.1